VGDLVFVNTYLTQLFRPLDMLGHGLSHDPPGADRHGRDVPLMDTEVEVKDAPGAPGAGGQPPHPHLRQRGLRLREGPHDPHGLSFEVPAGHQVALVGPSGAGKSTIARLVFRFYDPWSGRILIDGQDIREVTQSSLRAAHRHRSAGFGAVQRYHRLQHRLWPRRRAGRSRGGARAAALMPLIERLPKGFDTEVGERGLKLSGGEKQRVAIARTLVKNPPILLLDEATSALDTRTEQDILATLHSVAEEPHLAVHRAPAVDHCRCRHDSRAE
jgi:ABC-type transport system involved in Fe-S cluster assembly fused permease/ATPase subunit